MGRTAIEKIVARHVEREGEAPVEVTAGAFVSIRPRHVMTHDNTAAVLKKFRAIGAERVADPRQPVFALDHNIQDQSESNRAKYAEIEAFATEQGIDFWPAGSGIGHQIMVQEGYVRPGSLVVASDSHANLYGACSAVGTPVVRTDAAVLWATGVTWWQVPPTVRVELEGRLAPGVSGKDLILALIGAFRNDEVLNCACEFGGPGVASLTMDQRMTVANMTTEWGALVGWFPFDDVLEAWLRERARRPRGAEGPGGGRGPAFSEEEVARWREEAIGPDDDAEYEQVLTVDLGSVTPFVAGPDEVKRAVPLPEVAAARIPIQKAYLLSCVNSRLEDIAEAARVVGERRFAPGVEFYLAAASAEVQAEAERLGYWGTLVRAGARTLPPGCGPCIGLGAGTLEPGETAISATNRNFKGRMGSREARAYLASPAVVAASAVAGYITGPEETVGGGVLRVGRRVGSRSAARPAAVEIVEGFPAEVRGRLLYLPKDNMNTDGIYGKEFTYREDLTREEMAAAAMRNYDPGFQEKAREGDILVGGRNFGTGSSREQAVTALAARGIRLAIAASFSQTYQRNAINNGFVTIACPDLVAALAESVESGRMEAEPTIVVPGEAVVDFARSVVRWDGREFPFAPLSSVPQRIVAAGGAEAVARERLGLGGGRTGTR